MKSNPRNVQRLKYSSVLLTMIFSMGEPMPVTHLGEINTNNIILSFWKKCRRTQVSVFIY